MYQKQQQDQENDLARLIRLLARLPGLGQKSAQRMALHLLKKRDVLMLPLSDALQSAAHSIHACTICHNLDTEDPCHICTDARRDRQVICVVEDVADLWALEKSTAFKGLYHVLGGSLSMLNGHTPESLAIASLLTRCQQEPPRELILALNATVEGQTTAHYISHRLQGLGLKITRLAQGIPLGGELHYLDEGTLTTAINSRMLVG